MKKCYHVIALILSALKQCFNRPIRTIFDPTKNSQLIRQRLGGLSKKHTLNSTGHPHMKLHHGLKYTRHKKMMLICVNSPPLFIEKLKKRMRFNRIEQIKYRFFSMQLMMNKRRYY